MISSAPLDASIPLPLLVTGVAGVSGYAALAYFRQRYGDQVVGIRQKDNWPLSGPGVVACDAEDHAALAELFRRHRFRAVLDCAGNCALKKCELDPAMAWRINVDGVRNLLDVRTATVMVPIGDARAQSTAISDFIGYPLPGRSAWASLRISTAREPS